MTQYRLPAKRNAYRFRGGKIDVIAELPAVAASRIRAGHDVTVIVEVEVADPDVTDGSTT